MPRVVPRKFGAQVAIKTNGYAPAGDGTTVKTPSLVATRKATITPLSGRELYEARQVGAESTHKVTTRYDSVTADVLGTTHWMEPTIGARKFEIVGTPLNVHERNMFIEAHCKVREGA